MKLIDITNSHTELVTEQLGNTDANFVKVYSLGPTTVVYSGAPTHKDVLLFNKKRSIRNAEIDFAIKNILKTVPQEVEILHAPNIVELFLSIEEELNDAL